MRSVVGPLGHIYLPSVPEREQLMEACSKLATDGRVPLVLVAREDNEVDTWTAAGRFSLPRDAAQILGDDHPFRDVAAEDLVRVCHHPDAGDVVISGWRAGSEPLSFVFEKGAHSEVGPEETGGFFLLPKGVPIVAADPRFIRPVELRQAGLHALGKAANPPVTRGQTATDALRVITYNVYSCVGLDGRLSISRIARVLRQYDADVIALQEVDVQRSRTGHRDQALELAEFLDMSVHFHPAISKLTEHYGDAVLSHLPMRLVLGATLPGGPVGQSGEPRGALWVVVDAGDWELQLINTHLGLRRAERPVEVPNNALTRVASDHLPVVVDIKRRPK